MTIRIAFDGGALGAFALAPDGCAWDTDVQQCGGHVFAFPGPPVWITFAGAKPILADRTRVMLHRDGQVYRRSSVAGNGDYCRYISLCDAAVREITAEFDPAAAGDAEFRFSAPHAHLPAAVYAAFGIEIRAGLAQANNIRIAEACYRTARVAVAGAAAGINADRRMQGRLGQDRRGQDRRDLVEAAKSMINGDAGRDWTLAAIAGSLHVSPYHLTRSFRREAGVPMHRYLTDVRLRAGLELLLDGRARTVAEVAHHLGFASHAHFTTSFRALFGTTPSAARTDRKSDKILEAAPVAGLYRADV